MIRAIFFDLDDTLISYTEAERVAMEAGCDVAIAANPRLTRRALAEEIYQAYDDRFGYGTAGFDDLGTISVAELRRLLTTDALRKLGDAADPEFVAEINGVFEQAERKTLRPFADTLQTLDALAERFPLGVITNGPSAMQRAKLASLGLTGRFQLIVVDTEFGHPKPDARIFEYAARAIGFAPGELLFVGNSQEADVAGSVAAGWTSVWINADGEPLLQHLPVPHFTIQRLSQLLSISPIAGAFSGD